MYPSYQGAHTASTHVRDTQPALQYRSRINSQGYPSGPYDEYPRTISGATMSHSPFTPSTTSPMFPIPPQFRGPPSLPSRAGSMSSHEYSHQSTPSATGRQHIALSREQRGRCHIAGLPFEILSTIMGHVAAREEPMDINVRPRPLDNLKALSQTCSHWRKVLLESKEVWTDIPLSSAGWTKVALANSTPRAIQLAANSDFVRTNSERLMESLEHIHRADSLALYELFTPEVQAKLIGRPAPKLENLTITYDPNPSEGYKITIHEDLFARQVPKLRMLNLASCIIPSTIFLLQAPLTILNLENCATWRSMNDLINTFRHLSCLEHLSLFHSIPVAEVPPEGPPSVYLPRLKTLSLSGLSEQLAPALCTVGFPAALDILKMELWLQTPPNTALTHEEAVLNMDYVLAKRFFVDAIRAGVSYDYVGIEATECRYPGIRCLDPPPHSALPRRLDLLVHCIERPKYQDRPWTKSDWHSILYFLRNAFPIAKASQVFVSLIQVENWHWIRLLGGFTNLVQLELCGMACTSLARRREREEALDILPELVTLVVRGAPMDDPKTFKAVEILIEIMKRTPRKRGWKGSLVLKNCRLPHTLTGWLNHAEGMGYLEWHGPRGTI
ncbi:hypothetical protein OF83DRAFT_83060 [Amylostereum chailletii]|nr:hypothetical protein OF83DRAFT_83060 [Amylostereum chailletii]